MYLIRILKHKIYLIIVYEETYYSRFLH